MDNVLFIVRGLPGSGKTTLAHLLANLVYSADDYFTDSVDGYNFNPKYLKNAHEECRVNVLNAMQNDVVRIAVANTFTQEWEMEPYFELAKEYGYMVHTIVVENRHGSENIHGVPDDVISKMKNRFSINL